MNTVESVELPVYADPANRGIRILIKFSELSFKYVTMISNDEIDPVRKQIRIDLDAGVYGPIAPYGSGQVVTPQQI